MHFQQIFNGYLGFINRLIPKSTTPPVIGIDIGTSAVKAVAISTNDSSELEITAWGVEKIEGGDIKAALIRLFAKMNTPGQVPVSSVSGKGSLIRYIDMPRMPIDELRKSFSYELDKYFPFDPQSIYTDCFILDPKPKDKRMPVLVAAVKKEIVDERLRLFKDAGVDLSHLTINSIAVANAFERLGPAPAQTAQAKAILDVGGSVSTLLILKDRSPRFTRDIFIGSAEMTKQIANILGVDPNQAEALKCVPGERLNEVIDACDAAVSNLVSEIRLSMDYFMTEKNMQIDEFFLTGGGALLKGIETVFEKNLGMPVKNWDPLNGLKLSPEVAKTDIKAYSSQLGVAIGLALTKI
jgi:type IV pilus assembly protein PilM